MTLPKKGSRLIEVDGERYRWALHRKATHNQKQASAFLNEESSGRVRFVVEMEESKGSVLVVITIGWHKDMFKNWDVEHEAEVSITPALVRECISLGLESGWNPRSPGPAQILDLNARA